MTAGALNIQNEQGDVAGSNAVTGCSYTGTFKPHQSGRNLFAVELSLTGCDAAGAYGGVAYQYREWGDRLLRVMAFRADRQHAFHLNLRPR